MKIQVFAVLKEYFNQETTIDAAGINTVADVVSRMSALNPAAEKVLSRCRVAVDMRFVSGDYKLKEDDVICFVPPSSGG